MSVVATRQGFRRVRDPWHVRLWRKIKPYLYTDEDIREIRAWWRRRKNPVLRHITEYKKAHPDRAPFVVKGRCIMDNAGLYEHCRIARLTDYPVLNSANPRQPAPIMIVGSGLSALPFLEEIRTRHAAGIPIMALKGAHDWLIDNGIVPDYAVSAEPQQVRHDCFKRLRDDVVYFMASQCHPDTWEYMRGRKVCLWHCEIEIAQRTLPDWKGIPLVPGGPTTGLRSISIAYIMGFRTQELYGFDSCVTRERVLKLDGSLMRPEDGIHEVWVGEDGPYLTSLSMVPQVENLMGTLKAWPGIKVTAHGEGYLQAALRQGKAQGWPV